MPQLNILISDDLMEALNREAAEHGVKKAALVKAKLANPAPTFPKAKMTVKEYPPAVAAPVPVAANPAPLTWVESAKPHDHSGHVQVGPPPTTGVLGVKPRAATMPSALQLSTKTGMPIASCARFIAAGRVTMDGDEILLDGAPV